jgi:hypothetical protein
VPEPGEVEVQLLVAVVVLLPDVGERTFAGAGVLLLLAEGSIGVAVGLGFRVV